MLDGAEDRYGCCLAESAETGDCHHLAQVGKQVEISTDTATGTDFLHQVMDAHSALPAGGALAAGFMLKKLADFTNDIPQISALVNDENSA